MLLDDSLFEPSHRFPALKLDQYLICSHVAEQVKVDVPLHCISGKIEGFINFNKSCGHNEFMLIELDIYGLIIRKFGLILWLKVQ